MMAILIRQYVLSYLKNLILTGLCQKYQKMILRRYLRNWMTVEILRIRYLLIARMLRLIRLLMHYKKYRAFVATFLTLIPSLMPYLGTVFCVMCIYCTLGIQVFGGIVNAGNSDLPSTEMADSDYLLFNFNDYPNGMVTLFNLIVLGNWQAWMEDYAKLTGTVWTYAYFVSFYLITVLLLLNLIVAFVLEAFFAELELECPEDEEENKGTRTRGRRRNVGWSNGCTNYVSGVDVEDVRKRPKLSHSSEAICVDSETRPLGHVAGIIIREPDFSLRVNADTVSTLNVLSPFDKGKQKIDVTGNETSRLAPCSAAIAVPTNDAYSVNARAVQIPTVEGALATFSATNFAHPSYTSTGDFLTYITSYWPPIW
ncbi:Calcium-binding EF-hand [Artemisia annua]|uniref:Calcium-binding EF-hand n=1 Tax=Artemisia annua TaxID=35608 RepID=A0A2U1KYK5_ARTAN|nr:Calcium-binding EF-hand [Artemisia annua]